MQGRWIIGKRYEVIIVDDGSTDSTPSFSPMHNSNTPSCASSRWPKTAANPRPSRPASRRAGELYRHDRRRSAKRPRGNSPPAYHDGNRKRRHDYGIARKDRQDSSFRRRQSRQANRIRNSISQETIIDSASSLKLYKAECIKGMKLFNGARSFPRS